MKKILSIILLLCLVCSLAGCSQSDGGSSSSGEVSSPVLSQSGMDEGAEVAPTPAPVTTELVKAGPGVNLLTGESTLSEEAYGKRAVAVMINNISDCLPQYGIGSADVIFEALVEYNITRLMAVYGDYTEIPEVCSVRSCRYYYPQIAMGYDAKYLHCGIDDTYALPIVEELGIDNIDASYDTLGLFGRDQDRIDTGYAYEHTMYLDGANLKNAYDNESFRTDLASGYDTTWFDFAVDTQVPNGSDCTNFVINFSDGYYSDFTYNTETKTYFKDHSGNPHMDQKSGEQLNFTNVVVLETYVGLMPGDEYGRKKVDMIVENNAGYYVSEGKVVEIRWTKSSEEKPIELYNVDGSPLVLNQGKTYVGVTPADTFAVKTTN